MMPQFSNEPLGANGQKVALLFKLLERRQIETSFGEATKFIGVDSKMHKISFFSPNTDILNNIVEVGEQFSITGVIKDFDPNYKSTYINRVKLTKELSNIPKIELF
jgi:hypothetical protein